MRDKLFKGIAIVLSAVMLLVPVSDSCSMTVYANDLTDGVYETNLLKIIDMALATGGGILGNEDCLEYLESEYTELLYTFGDGYLHYCVDNSLEVNKDSLLAYFDATETDYGAFEALLRTDAVMDTFLAFYAPCKDSIESLVVTEKDKFDVLGLVKDVGSGLYTIGDSVVEFFVNLFNENKAELTGYVYVKTYSPSEISVTWFETLYEYNNTKAYVESSENVTLLRVYMSSSYAYNTVMSGEFTLNNLLADNDKSRLFVDNGSKLVPYDSNSLAIDKEGCYILSTDYAKEMSLESLQTAISENSSGSLLDGVAMAGCELVSAKTNTWWIPMTKDGRNIKVYTSEDAMKLDITGTNPYSYYTTTEYNDFSTDTDNSITYSGDYIGNYSEEYSYNTVNNSNDYSQTNIDNSVTNITNNYTYVTEGGSDGDGSGGSDSDVGLGDALLALVNGVKDFLAFILNLLGELISVLSNFLNSALEMLKGLTGLFGGFTELLGSIFTFVPQELIDVLTTGITLIVILGVIRSLKG